MMNKNSVTRSVTVLAMMSVGVLPFTAGCASDEVDASEELDDGDLADLSEDDAESAGTSEDAFSGPEIRIEAEHMAESFGTITTFKDGDASNREARGFWSNGRLAINAEWAEAGKRRFKLRVRGDVCGGSPKVRLWVVHPVTGIREGRERTITNRGYQTITMGTINVRAGKGQIAVSFPNDARGNGCDRNLFVDYVSMRKL